MGAPKPLISPCHLLDQTLEAHSRTSPDGIRRPSGPPDTLKGPAVDPDGVFMKDSRRILFRAARSGPEVLGFQDMNEGAYSSTWMC